jgi:hypothetical protein
MRKVAKSKSGRVAAAPKKNAAKKNAAKKNAAKKPDGKSKAASHSASGASQKAKTKAAQPPPKVTPPPSIPPPEGVQNQDLAHVIRKVLARGKLTASRIVVARDRVTIEIPRRAVEKLLV